MVNLSSIVLLSSWSASRIHGVLVSADLHDLLSLTRCCWHRRVGHCTSRKLANDLVGLAVQNGVDLSPRAGVGESCTEKPRGKAQAIDDVTLVGVGREGKSG
jgi:hypothetical protein